MRERESVGDNSSEDYFSPNSTKGNVEKMDVHDFIVKWESSMMKNKRKLKILEEENLELSSHNDHLSRQVKNMGLKDNVEGVEILVSFLSSHLFIYLYALCSHARYKIEIVCYEYDWVLYCDNYLGFA